MSWKKMKMEGEIICRENIKPYSPTPYDKKNDKLSLLDQILPPITVPLILYYPNPNPKTTKSTCILKQSLSQTLTRFYPFAGRIKDSFSIDCNDQGALLVVAKFNSLSLSDFLKKPVDLHACRAHIPSQHQLNLSEPGPGCHVAMFQVNHFQCGGIAIGSLFSHAVADGVTVSSFLKAWAAIARGLEEEALFPDYAASSLFHQNTSMQRESHLFSVMLNYFKIGKTVVRRYVFDGPTISKLRADLLLSTSEEEGLKRRRPSRVEIVSALMWKCFMLASSSSSSSAGNSDYNSVISLVSHSLNMRRKADDPSFSDHSFGNFLWLAPASTVNNQNGRDLKHLLGKLRSAISHVDIDFVKRMQGEEGYFGYCKNLEETLNEFPKNVDYLSFTSWCNFGLYGLDFGWGNPAWIMRCDAGSDGQEWPFINMVWLMDTKEGDGVEAWLTLDQRYLAEFDKIQELRDLASVDPSPMETSILSNEVGFSLV